MGHIQSKKEFEEFLNKQELSKSIENSKKRLSEHLKMFNKVTDTTPEERHRLLVDYIKTNQLK